MNVISVVTPAEKAFEKSKTKNFKLTRLLKFGHHYICDSISIFLEPGVSFVIFRPHIMGEEIMICVAFFSNSAKSPLYYYV